MQPRVQLTMTKQVAARKPHSMKDRTVSMLNTNNTCQLTIFHIVYLQIQIFGGKQGYRKSLDSLYPLTLKMSIFYVFLNFIAIKPI